MEAQVSVSTVSRVLRGDTRISKATTQRVHEAVARTGYKANPLVSALMAQLRSGNPPSAVCNLAWLNLYKIPSAINKDPTYMAFIRGAQARARSLNYSLNIINVAESRRGGMGALLHSRGIQGVLLPYFDEYQGLATNIPIPLEEFTIVGVGMRFENPGLHYSSNDQYTSGCMVAQKLWSLGYRRIGYTGQARTEHIVNRRFSAGYMQTIRHEFGGAVPEPLLVGDNYDGIEAWIERFRLDAIITTSRVLHAILRSKGIRIPGDIGYAHLNIEAVEGASPGEIAGIQQDCVGVGEHAVDLLINLLYRNERGVPQKARGLESRGTWRDGASVKPQI